MSSEKENPPEGGMFGPLLEVVLEQNRLDFKPLFDAAPKEERQALHNTMTRLYEKGAKLPFRTEFGGQEIIIMQIAEGMPPIPLLKANFDTLLKLANAQEGGK